MINLIRILGSMNVILFISNIIINGSNMAIAFNVAVIFCWSICEIIEVYR